MSVGCTPHPASLFISDMAQGHGGEFFVYVKHILRTSTSLTPKELSLTLLGHRGHFLKLKMNPSEGVIVLGAYPV